MLDTANVPAGKKGCVSRRKDLPHKSRKWLVTALHIQILKRNPSADISLKMKFSRSVQ